MVVPNKTNLETLSIQQLGVYGDQIPLGEY